MATYPQPMEIAESYTSRGWKAVAYEFWIKVYLDDVLLKEIPPMMFDYATRLKIEEFIQAFEFGVAHAEARKG